MDIRADWEAQVFNEQEILVKVTVTLDTYSNYAGPAPLIIELAGQSVTLETPAISYDDNTQKTSLELGSHSFTVLLSEGCSCDLDLNVEWQWGGRYGGIDIPVVECGGSLTVDR